MPGPTGQFASYAINDAIHAITTWYSPTTGLPNLIVGGSFTMLDGGSFNGVAAWDGTNWTRLGAGLTPGTNGFGGVAAAIPFNGDLVCTGFFSAAGGIQNVARWNGSAWLPMSTINASGASLAIYNGQLYLGGGFTAAGTNTSVRGLGRWDGAAWQPVGGMITGGFGSVNSMEVYNGELVVGGRFDHAGPVAAANIARWNGTNWATLGTGTNDYVLALKFRPTDNSLYAGGTFLTAGGLSVNGLARWDGSWHTVGPFLAGEVRALENYGNNLAIGGNFAGMGTPSIIQWNGSAFSPMGSGGADSAVDALGVFNDSLAVGGWFGTIGGVASPKVAQWSGARIGGWSGLKPAPNAAVLALLPSGSGFYAAGDFDCFSNPTDGMAHRIISTDGVTANVVTNIAGGGGPPNGTNGSIRALANYTTGSIILPRTSLVVGGSFTAAGGFTASNIAQFDLSGWAAMGTGTDGAINAVQQYRVSSTNNHLVVTGEFSSAGGVPCNHIAQWNGAWTALGSGLAGVSGNALTLYNGELYVGGNFSSAGGIPASDIARWNGTAWNALSGTAFVGGINAMVVYNGQLIAAGDFQTTNAQPAFHYAAAWNAGVWTPMQAGLPPLGSGFFPLALAVHNGDLYLGGNFAIVDSPGDGIFDSVVYQWNGSAWAAVSGPLSGGVFALASAVGDLWAGGSFTVGDGHWTPHLARLECTCYANCGNSTSSPALNVNDFICFQGAFASGHPYANCDGSTAFPILNVNDFICFQGRFAAGCP